MIKSIFDFLAKFFTGGFSNPQPALGTLPADGLLKMGDKSDAVGHWQEKLKALKFYSGKIDKSFGPLMLAAVKAVQADANLEIDGILGPDTMEYINFKLENPNIETPKPLDPPPADPSTRLEIALGKITGKFEGKGFSQVSGDFDGQGLSVGVLQWNFGQGSLQDKILKPYILRYGSIDSLKIFPVAIDHLANATIESSLRFCRANMLVGTSVKSNWRTAWEIFLGSERTIGIQLEAASGVEQKAEAIMREMGLSSLQAFCFAFDVVTQNGGMSDVKLQNPNRAAAKIELEGWVAGSDAGASDFNKNRGLWLQMLPGAPEECVSLLRTAIARARKAKQAWDTDVLNRKGTIAMGAGRVHDEAYNFSSLFQSGPAQESPDAEGPIGAGLLDIAKKAGIALEPIQMMIDFQKKTRPDKNPRFWAFFDVSQHSSKKRYHLLDRVNQTVTSYPCAHGSGSDQNNDGYAERFSNVSGSKCTSLGIYRTAETYYGKNGLSLRLDGQESTNSNARSRAVVMHGSNYVEESYIKSVGRAGRSEGCPATPMSSSKDLVTKMAGGSLLIIWKPGA